MLTAAQIDALRSKSEQLLDPVTDFLIENIARRISEAGQLTGTASYQTWKLQQLGVSQKKLKKEIAKRLRISQNEAEKLLTQAAKTGYNFDISRFPTKKAIPFAANSSLQQILDNTVKLAREDLSNMTQTIGFVGPDGVCRELTDAYNQACDFAFQKVSTGAQDYMSAIRDATRNLAEKGIRMIDYESGVHTSMEAAVRRNIMGGLGLMQEQISQENHDMLGCDGWEISAHGGSAPDHEPIQGKQYTDKEFERINNSMVRRIGTLNCGHAAFPIILGVNEPQYTEEELEELRQQNETGVTYEGKHYTLYEATQRQRKFERTIRKQKRRILVNESTGDKDKLQANQIKLVRLREEYKRFSKGVGLPMQHTRMETAGFDWKKGKAAEKAAKEAQRAEKSVAKSKNGGTMSVKESSVKKNPWDNGLPPRGQVTEEIAAENLDSWVANELKVSEVKAAEYVDAIKAYTDAESKVYSEVRRYQRNQPLEFLAETEAKKLSEDIEEYIQKAPRWNGGATFRGGTISDAELSDCVPGSSIEMGGTSSWSATKSIAQEFAEHNTTKDRPNMVVYHCETQSKGTGIKHISVWPEEDEVLCSRDSNYKVIRTERDNKNITHIYLAEVQ